MAVPTAFGRNLPKQDWEGDDFTPGAGGKYVTCMDTAAGRMVAWATNGRINKDGRVYRAAVHPHDPNGITMEQADQAVHTVAGLDIVRPAGWNQATVIAHLRAGKGLIIIGLYSSLPRAYRFQASAAFAHGMFVTHISGSNMRLYDPLDPNTNVYGRVVPASLLWPYLISLPTHYQVGYVPLQHL